MCVSAYVAYMQFRSKRENLKLIFKMGAMTYTSSGLGEWEYLIEVINIGERTVTISSAQLKLPNNKYLNFPFVQPHLSLPYELTMGKNCLIGVSLKQLGYSLINAGYQGKINVIPQIITQGGKNFSAKSTELDINDLIK